MIAAAAGTYPYQGVQFAETHQQRRFQQPLGRGRSRPISHIVSSGDKSASVSSIRCFNGAQPESAEAGVLHRAARCSCDGASSAESVENPLSGSGGLFCRLTASASVIREPPQLSEQQVQPIDRQGQSGRGTVVDCACHTLAFGVCKALRDSVLGKHFEECGVVHDVSPSTPGFGRAARRSTATTPTVARMSRTRDSAPGPTSSEPGHGVRA